VIGPAFFSYEHKRIRVVKAVTPLSKYRRCILLVTSPPDLKLKK